MMKKGLLLCVLSAFIYGCKGDGTPSDVARFLKTQATDSDFTWMEVYHRYQYCNSDKSEWNMEISPDRRYKDFVYTCVITDEVAKTLPGYGEQWTTPITYTVIHRYEIPEDKNGTVTQRDYTKIRATSIDNPSSHRLLADKFNAMNFIRNQSPAEIIKIWKEI